MIRAQILAVFLFSTAWSLLAPAFFGLPVIPALAVIAMCCLVAGTALVLLIERRLA